MEFFRKVRLWNTKILTFSQYIQLDVTHYHFSHFSRANIYYHNRIFKKCEDVNFSVFGAQRRPSTMASVGPKIVIVGAGAAGISAAAKLVENGFSNLIILEAEDRIGGRIHSVDFDGSVVDLGGQWCHGEEGNVVYEMVEDLNLLSPSHNNYSDFTFYSPNGTIDKSITDCLLQVALVVWHDEEASKRHKGAFGDYFIAEYNKRIRENFSHQEDALKLSELLLGWFHQIILCLDPAESWFDISATGIFNYTECDGDYYLQWRNKGYRIIFDVLMKKIPDITEQLPVEDKILLNKEVNKIIWDQNNDTVTLNCSDGSSYNCDHVIVTVSLGVLKHISKNFMPKLPFAKQNAIDAMAIGTVNKILLEFPAKWWPDDLRGFSFLWTEEDRKHVAKKFSKGLSHNGRSWLEDINGFYVIDSHPRMLLGWVVGKMAGEVETLPDNTVIDGCIFLLKKFLGHTYNIPQPNAVLRSKWKSNPHFKGAYTYPCVQAQLKGVSNADLASPVLNSGSKQVLLFAGEGTHSHFYSTVHGAIETGFREAERILNMYKSCKLMHRKVGIIGAGMAGLGAASTLQKLGCSDFLIIEAQSKPGGRVHSLELDGNILELGAQWIHGRENPLYELARRHDLLSEATSEEGLGVHIRDNGEIIDEDIVKRVDFEIGKILTECEKFEAAVNYPRSVGEYMEKRFAEYLAKCRDSDVVKEIKLELFDWHVRFQIIDNSCVDLSQLSAKDWGKYVCIDDKAHFNLKCGYQELVSILVDDLPEHSLLLCTPVAQIHCASKPPQVNKLICKDGSIITCDYLIITPSLGVLKSYLKISPVLPREMCRSIDDLGFHGIGKIFLIFDRKWWDVDGFQFVWRRNSIPRHESSWTRHITGFEPIVHGSNVLLGWIGGEGVQAMEALSDKEVGTRCVELLRRFVRDRIVPEPLKVIRTRWCSNPWIRGGYSHITSVCDLSGSAMHKLSEPVFVDGKPRILIAGEAAHPSHYSTAHGAFESGQQQAELLAGYIMNSKL